MKKRILFLMSTLLFSSTAGTKEFVLELEPVVFTTFDVTVEGPDLVVGDEVVLNAVVSPLGIPGTYQWFISDAAGDAQIIGSSTGSSVRVSCNVPSPAVDDVTIDVIFTATQGDPPNDAGQGKRTKQIPTSQTHVMGAAMAFNDAEPVSASDETILRTTLLAVVNIQLKDQLGRLLGSGFNGQNRVQEKFTNLDPAGGPFPIDWTNIDKPDATLSNGVKLDGVLNAPLIVVGGVWTPQEVQDWRNFQSRVINGSTVNNVTPFHPAVTFRATQHIRVKTQNGKTYEVAPTFRRTESRTQQNILPPVPWTVTDVAQ